jgi:hypothetical protein
MEPFEVYRYYLALRLHFTTDQYDAIKQKGKVRASRQAFAKRNDLIAIRKIAETYSDKDIVNFLVANFITGDRWGGVFDTEAKERFMLWKKRIESLSYTFEKEISYLQLQMEKQSKPFDYVFAPSKNEHPYILKSYLRRTTSIETLVILNNFYNFVDNFDKEYYNDLMWPDISRIIKKYSPFLNVQQEKYNGILRRAIGLDAP